MEFNNIIHLILAMSVILAFGTMIWIVVRNILKPPVTPQTMVKREDKYFILNSSFQGY